MLMAGCSESKSSFEERLKTYFSENDVTVIDFVAASLTADTASVDNRMIIYYRPDTTYSRVINGRDTTVSGYVVARLYDRDSQVFHEVLFNEQPDDETKEIYLRNPEIIK